MSGYGELASEVYDTAYPVGHSMAGDVERYLRLLDGVRGRVLEPAVGNGRVLVPLMQAGYDVDGYDLSAAMVARCRAHCRSRGLVPRVEQGDMTTFVRPATYAAAVLPAGSIVLLDGRGATRSALSCLHASLVPGGLLAVDVPAPQLLTGAEGLRTWESGPTVWTLQTLGADLDAVANQTTRWLRYDRWDDGSLVASELLRFRLQHWSIEEFTDLLTGSGFGDVTVAGGDGGTPRSGGDVWTFRGTRT